MSLRLQDATKTALAMVLVYWIALKLDWLNPYWAGLTVAMISLPTAGQSIHKGMQRLSGTIPGCLAALAALSLAPQDRWAYLAALSAWVFFTTYMMTGPGNSYMWQVAGFVCLIVGTPGLSSEGSFDRALFRTLETVLGIVVYTLMTVFIWPRTNKGAIKKAARNLLLTQAQFCCIGRDRLRGQGSSEGLLALRRKQLQQLNQLVQAFEAEGSESYEVRELRRPWARFRLLSRANMDTLDRWHVELERLEHLGAGVPRQALESLLTEIEERLERMGGILSGLPPGSEPAASHLPLGEVGTSALKPLDRAAFDIKCQELEQLEVLTRSLFECVMDLEGHRGSGAASGPPPRPLPRDDASGFPVPDPDRLRAAAFTTIAMAAGYLTWIFFDPPGHQSLYKVTGSTAMAVAVLQQVRPTMIFKPVGALLPVGILVYVLVLPKLSGFMELGAVIFLYIFLVCLIFDGLLRLGGLLGFLMMVPIQNRQMYDFAASANLYISILMVGLLLWAASYIIRCMRPERAFLSLLRRFFHSAAFLMSGPEGGSTTARRLWRRFRTAFHLQELRSLPEKMDRWGRSIDFRRYPDGMPERVQDLVASLLALRYRIEGSLEADSPGTAGAPAPALRVELEAWRAAIRETLAGWSTRPEVEPAEGLSARLASMLERLEKLLEEAAEPLGKKQAAEEEVESFCRALGGYHGVSMAAVHYAKKAHDVDWSSFREERFGI